MPGGYFSTTVKESGTVLNQSLYNRFEYYASQTGIALERVRKLEAVAAPGLIEDFEAARKSIWRRQTAAPHLHCKSDWQQMTDSDQRQRFLSLFQRTFDCFPKLQEPNKADVIPVFHGSTRYSYETMCQGGFAYGGNIANAQFGVGMYTTTNFNFGEKYATTYRHRYHQSSTVVLLALAVPGNIFPIIEEETFRGSPCRPGYQSHLTVVDLAREKVVTSTTVQFSPLTTSTELVTFETGQLLPLFIIELYD